MLTGSGASGSPTKAGPVAAVDKIAVVSESQQSGRFDGAFVCDLGNAPLY